MKGKSLQFDIPLVVWACARVNFYHEALLVSSAVNPYHEALLVSSAQRLKSGRDLKTLNDWGLCALEWSYDVLDHHGRFAEFKTHWNRRESGEGFLIQMCLKAHWESLSGIGPKVEKPQAEPACHDSLCCPGMMRVFFCHR